MGNQGEDRMLAGGMTDFLNMNYDWAENLFNQSEM